MLGINGETRILGLLGHHIAFSLSPMLHNFAADQFRKNIVYLPFDMPTARLADLLAVAWDMGALGFNVTMPHKESVAGMITGHGFASVNTLYRGEHGWCATSTDGQGFDRAVSRLGVPLDAFDRLIILGNGGASVAILSYLLQELRLRSGVEINVFRRSGAKDDRFRQALGSNQPSPRFYDFSPQQFRDVMSAGGKILLVQATSAPIHGDKLDQFADVLMPFTGACIDLVYGSKRSKIFCRARELGVPSQDGLPMLIEQARCSQECWWGKSVEYDLLVEVVKQYNMAF